MKKNAIHFIVLMGIVSMLADTTYEGGRSITGPFLAVLGSSGAAVGAIVGLGECIGYGIRILSGYAADRTRWYWPLIFAGYAINLLAIPMLALAGSWQWAGVLLILERLGKGLRTPARDALLSYATQRVGRGWGFGLHEGLDQIGAIAGPLFMVAILFFRHQYALAFACLLIPALAALGMLLTARMRFPRPQEMEPKQTHIETKGYPRRFWIYVLASCCVGAGFVDFALIGYHFQKSDLLSTAGVPLVYAMAMAVDGISALWMGKAFDKRGIIVLGIATLISALFAPFVFFGGSVGVLIGIALWGVGLGAQESIMRSFVATIIPAQRRASAYGVLYLCFGVSWFLGSSLIGALLLTTRLKPC